MPKTRMTIASLVALALLAGTPAVAQRGWQQGTWDREAFWRDAPTNMRDRVEFLQRRIDSGVRDGSLTRREAADLNRRLATIRRDVRRGNLTPSRRNSVQARLDDLSRQIRWQRHDDDRFATNYDASRYYRNDPRYGERRLTAQDEVYRGSDGRYYCKRSDGTTGLVVGAIGGSVLGNVIDGGRNRVAGTLIGGALGALVGSAIDQSNNDLRCR